MYQLRSSYKITREQTNAVDNIVEKEDWFTEETKYHFNKKNIKKKMSLGYSFSGLSLIENKSLQVR